MAVMTTESSIAFTEKPIPEPLSILPLHFSPLLTIVELSRLLVNVSRTGTDIVFNPLTSYRRGNVPRAIASRLFIDA